MQKNIQATSLLAALAGAGATFGLLGGQERTAPFQATPIPILTPEQQRILSHLSLVELDDGAGGTVTTIRITGANLQLVNGLGATNGNPADPDSVQPGATVTNGLGNLIVGYNEEEPLNPRVRTGSHNVIVGSRHAFTSFGGMTVGQRNESNAPYASVSGGRFNQASGFFAAVSGGSSNVAVEADSTVAGGQLNRAEGSSSWVGGGRLNRAAGLGAAVLGGEMNVAGGTFAWIGGGRNNQATLNSASVLGGDSNIASGTFATVQGGQLNNASGSGATVSGGAFNLAIGFAAAVSGGNGNAAEGAYSVIGGGLERSVTGAHDWRAGLLFQDF